MAHGLAEHYFQEKTANWYISSIGAEGIDIARKEKLHRLALVNRITIYMISRSISNRCQF
jgi:hypothetical protein